MAEVTGFTADRMRIIENETVVDGEVQGDNLILVTREGTPIDAGNVRGPVGPQGIAGPVPSVNDQTGAVYTPRAFPTRADIDTDWAQAPNGSHAWTIDSETNWVKVDGAWVVNNAIRVYNTKAAMETGWPAASAPEGSMVSTLADRSLWLKDGSGWVLSTPPKVFDTYANRDARWPNPPRGSQAVILESDSRTYMTPQGWTFDNGVRVFASPAERDAKWPVPPAGAMCLAPNPIPYIYGPGGWRAVSGHRIAASCSVVGPVGSTMNGNQDHTYIEQFGAFPFPTLATVTFSSVYLSPDRDTPGSCALYSNSFSEPGSSNGRIFDGVPASYSCRGNMYNTLGTYRGEIPLPNGQNGPAWTLRMSGVQGGPTNYGYSYVITFERIIL